VPEPPPAAALAGDCNATAFPLSRLDGAVVEVLLRDGGDWQRIVTAQVQSTCPGSVRLKGATVKVGMPGRGTQLPGQLAGAAGGPGSKALARVCAVVRAMQAAGRPAVHRTAPGFLGGWGSPCERHDGVAGWMYSESRGCRAGKVLRIDPAFPGT
jgi:hypothetical protein